MKKLLIVCLVIGCLTMANAALAYPFCGPSQPPDQYAAFCRYDLVANDTYRLAPGVPFAWLRTQPLSHAGIRATIRPSSGASLVTVGGSAHWDGVQWWYEVAIYPSRHITGWVERVSLSQMVLQSATVPLPPTPTPAPLSDPSIQVQANWGTPFAAVVETGTPFLWLREAPNHGAILATLGASAAFTVEGPAAFDGRQWWWRVTAHGFSGWVEQGSITLVG